MAVAIFSEMVLVFAGSVLDRSGMAILLAQPLPRQERDQQSLRTEVMEPANFQLHKAARA
jgi:hypothetical protein